MTQQRELIKRKKVFRELIKVFESSHKRISKDNWHSKDYVKNVLNKFSSSQNWDIISSLLETPYKLTSTKQGHTVLKLSSVIIEDKKIGREFIDAELIQSDIILHFEKTQAPKILLPKINEVVKPFGVLFVLAVPGDELFESVHAISYILHVVPNKTIDRIVKKKGYIVRPVDLGEGHCMQCPLTERHLDELLALSYGFESATESDRDNILKYVSEAITSTGIPQGAIRMRIVKAIAAKGVKNKDFNNHQQDLVNEWAQFLTQVSIEKDNTDTNLDYRKSKTLKNKLGIYQQTVESR